MGISVKQRTDQSQLGDIDMEKQQQVKDEKKTAFRILFKLRWLLLGLVLFVVIVGAIGTIWVNSLDISKLATPVASPTQMMDKNGKIASEITSLKTEQVSIKQIPITLQQAIVAVEDKRYYDHSGVDGFGILRAAFRNVKDGSAAEGGSTITQQLAKNVFLNSRKTLSRKITEVAYAWKIESTYDKDQILEMYLNQIYFGEGQWGIQRAAKRYFGKEPKDLTLSESAMLAALPKAPSRYSPYQNKELALERRNLVLGLMLEEQFISEADYNGAIIEPIRVLIQKPERNGLLGKYASYADAVIDEAIQKYGFTERQLLAGNLKIYTQLDPTVQNAMETVYKNDSLFPPSASDQIVQSGSVVMDPISGGVRGLVGQRGEHVFRGFNHATQLKRQPGSIFKPLIVYAPALEKGYTPNSRLYDGPLDINGYQPQDWDHQTRGEVSLREAVTHSWNIPPVWLLNEMGLQTGKKFVEKLGIPLQQEDDNLGLALGGLSRGVSPLQIAQAYSIFPNLGTLTQAHFIVKITSADGTILVEAKPQKTEVMSQENAYTMTDLLLGVVNEGTGSKAAMDRPTAGKTGTTQLPDVKQFDGISGGSKDAWFAGYTPELVGVVWMGYDDTDSKHYLTTSGGNFPALVFKEIMTLALKDIPKILFKQPNSWKSNPNTDKKMNEDKDNQGKEEDNEEHKDNKKEGKGNKDHRKQKGNKHNRDD
jgi:penicillin-binding protein 2A